MSEARNNSTAGFALYDRWEDAKMDKSEFVGVYTARSLAVAAWLAAQSSANVSQHWGIQLTGDSQITAGTINFPNGNPALGTPATAQLTSSHNLTDARIVWEVGGSQSHIGSTLSFERNTVGESRIEAEAALPDGRRVFGTTTVYVNDPQNGWTPFDPNDPNVTTFALYHFNGDSDDSSGNAYNLGVSSGSVSFSDNTTWMKNPVVGVDKVAHFSGLGDKLTATIPRNKLLDTTDPQNPAPAPLTIEFYIYPRSYPKVYSGFGEPFKLRQDDNSQWALQYNYDQNQAQNNYWISACGTTLLDSAGWEQYLPKNTWHKVQIKVQADGTTDLYIDDIHHFGPFSTTYTPHTAPYGGNNYGLVSRKSG